MQKIMFGIKSIPPKMNQKNRFWMSASTFDSHPQNGVSFNDPLGFRKAYTLNSPGFLSGDDLGPPPSSAARIEGPEDLTFRKVRFRVLEGWWLHGDPFWDDQMYGKCNVWWFLWDSPLVTVHGSVFNFMILVVWLHVDMKATPRAKHLVWQLFHPPHD